MLEDMVMLKKTITYLFLLLLPNLSFASNPTEEAAFNPEGVLPSDELLDYFRTAVPACQALINKDVTRDELCAIALTTLTKIKKEYEIRNSFYPEAYRRFQQNSDLLIKLKKHGGEAQIEILPKDTQARIYNSEEYTIPQLQQMTLLFIFGYYEMACQVHFLSQGTLHIPGFNNYSSAATLPSKYREACCKKDPELKNKTHLLGSDEDILNKVIEEHHLDAHKKQEACFEIIFGISPTHYHKNAPDQGPYYSMGPLLRKENPMSREELLQHKCYRALEAIKLSNFSLQLPVSSLEVLAPLSTPHLRINIMNRLRAQGAVRKVNDKSEPSIEDPAFPVHAYDDPEMLAQIRFARNAAKVAAQTLIEPLRLEINSLTQSRDRLESENQKLNIALATADLLDSKPKRKTSPSKTQGETERLKREITALNKKIVALQKELKEKQTLIDKFHINQAELLGMHNHWVTTNETLQKEFFCLQRSLAELTQQLAEHTSRGEVFTSEMAKNIGVSGLVELVQKNSALVGENASLRETNEFLSSKEKLLLTAHRQLRKHHQHLEIEFHTLAAGIYEQSKDLEQTQKRSNELEIANAGLHNALQIAKVETDEDRQRLMHVGQLYCDNAQLAEENRALRQALAEQKLEAIMAGQRYQLFQQAEYFKSEATKHFHAASGLYEQNKTLTQEALTAKVELAKETQARLALEEEIKALKKQLAGPRAEGSSSYANESGSFSNTSN